MKVTFEEEGGVVIEGPVRLGHAFKVRVVHLSRLWVACPRLQMKLSVELKDEGEDIMDDLHHTRSILGQQTPETTTRLALETMTNCVILSTSNQSDTWIISRLGGQLHCN